MGLVTTELVINALKHAFPNDSAGEIRVSYEVDEANWRLSVSDDGAGLRQDGGRRPIPAWGTASSKRSRINSRPPSRRPFDRPA